MKYNVSQMLLSPTGTSSQFVTEEDYLIENILVSNGMIINMCKMHEGIWVNVTGTGKMKGFCSRCVNEFEYVVDIQGEQEFVSILDLIANEIEHDGFLIDEKHELDVEELIRQSAIVANDIKLLCSTACKGICSLCGISLNELDCECEERPTDPRWNALLELTKENL